MTGTSTTRWVFPMLIGGAICFVGLAGLAGMAIVLPLNGKVAVFTLVFMVMLLYGWIPYAFLHYRHGRQEEFLHFLSVTVEANVPLAPALRAYLHDRPRGNPRDFCVAFLLFFVLPGYYWFWHKQHNFDQKIANLAVLLELGVPLSHALEEVPGLLPRETIVLSELGEQIGQLAVCLRQSTHQRLSKIWLEVLPRIVYPLVLILFLNGVLTFWMTFTLPKMEKICKEMAVPMPYLTRWAADSWNFIAFAAGVIVVGIPLLLALGVMLLMNGRARWHCPGVRLVYRRYVQAQVLRFLGLLLAAGKTVPESLRLLSEADYFPEPVKEHLSEVWADVEKGEPLAAGLRHEGLLPASMTPLVQAAERVHNLPWALGELGELLIARTVRAVQRLSILIAPTSVFVIGVCVGLIVVAMLLPLFEIMRSLAE